jgi:hypothetical protein
MWLMAADLSGEARVGRAIAIKKEDLNIDLALSQAGTKVSPAISQRAIEASSAAIEWSKGQREIFLKDAGASGTKSVSLPTNRAMAALANGEYEYVLTSGLAHGSTTAYGAVDGMLRAKDPSTAGVMLMAYVTTVVDAYCRAGWALAGHVLSPGAKQTIVAALDRAYDDVGMLEEPREYFKGVLEA